MFNSCLTSRETFSVGVAAETASNRTLEHIGKRLRNHCGIARQGKRLFQTGNENALSPAHHNLPGSEVAGEPLF
jgi:hypothetical protein